MNHADNIKRLAREYAEMRHTHGAPEHNVVSARKLKELDAAVDAMALGEPAAASGEAAAAGIDAALAMFPLNWPSQQFVISGGLPLRADGDDEFYSKQRVLSFMNTLHGHLTIAKANPAGGAEPSASWLAGWNAAYYSIAHDPPAKLPQEARLPSDGDYLRWAKQSGATTVGDFAPVSFATAQTWGYFCDKVRSAHEAPQPARAGAVDGIEYERLFAIIRGYGFTTSGQTDTLVKAILAAATTAASGGKEKS